MALKPANLRKHQWVTCLLLLALTFRALIPAGFMPSGAGQFGLQICPDGFPAQLLAGSGHDSLSPRHHHASDEGAPGKTSHDHKAWMSGHCAFAAVASAPPLWQPHVLAVALTSFSVRVPDSRGTLPHSHRFQIAQPRAPPVFA